MDLALYKTLVDAWTDSQGADEFSDFWCKRIAAVSKGLHQSKSFVHGNNWTFLHDVVTVQQVPATTSYRESMPALFGSVPVGQLVPAFVSKKSKQLLPVSEDVMQILAWALKRSQLLIGNKQEIAAASVAKPLRQYTQNHLLQDLRHQVDFELNLSTDAKRRGLSCDLHAKHMVVFLQTCQEVLPFKNDFVGGRLLWQQKELDYIVKYSADYPRSELTHMLNQEFHKSQPVRSVAAVVARSAKLGRKAAPEWTTEELQMLVDLRSQGLSMQDITAEFALSGPGPRSYLACNHQAHKLITRGLLAPTMVPYCAKDVKLLLQLMTATPEATFKEIAVQYNEAAVYARGPDSLANQFYLHTSGKKACVEFLLLRIARLMGMHTSTRAVDTASLAAALGSKQSADIEQLQELLGHVEQLTEVANRTHTDSTEVLRHLPGEIGGDEWISAMEAKSAMGEQIELLRTCMQYQRRLQQGFTTFLSTDDVWKHPALLQYNNQRDHVSLPSVIGQLVVEATPYLTAALQSEAQEGHAEQHIAFTPLLAHERLSLLPDGCPADCKRKKIEDVPLQWKGSKLATLQHAQWDQQQLPLLPGHIDALYQPGGPLHQQKLHMQSQQRWGWSKPIPLSLENAPEVFREAGSQPIVYAMLLTRAAWFGKGCCGSRRVLSTELYVGIGEVGVARMHGYLSLKKARPPGPWGEISKYSLWFAAHERGFDFHVKMLHLDGLSPEGLRGVENYYLQYDWPLNKCGNGDHRRHIKLGCSLRMPWPSLEKLPMRMDQYPLSRRIHEQARMGTLPEEDLHRVESFVGMPPWQGVLEDICIDTQSACPGELLVKLM
ncbi:hypothetical protein ABBQ38_004977 [Trebouxia sp. C0009 RCD-2024]